MERALLVAVLAITAFAGHLSAKGAGNAKRVAEGAVSGEVQGRK